RGRERRIAPCAPARAAPGRDRSDVRPRVRDARQREGRDAVEAGGGGLRPVPRRGEASKDGAEVSRRSMRKIRAMSLYGTTTPPNRCDVVVYDEVFDFALLERGTYRDSGAPAEPPVTLDGVRAAVEHVEGRSRMGVSEKIAALAAEASPGRAMSAWQESLAKWLP